MFRDTLTAGFVGATCRATWRQRLEPFDMELMTEEKHRHMFNSNSFFSFCNPSESFLHSLNN